MERLVRIVILRVECVTVGAPDRLLRGVLDAVGDVEIVPPHAARQLETHVVAATLLVAARARRDLHALDALLEDDVDDARNCGGAVDGRLVARKDVDALDHARRDARQVREIGLSVVEQRVIGQRAAIQQDQREARREAEQADGRGARSEAAGELVVLDRAGSQRLGTQNLADILEALTIDVLGADCTTGEAVARSIWGIQEPVTMTGSSCAVPSAVASWAAAAPEYAETARMPLIAAANWLFIRPPSLPAKFGRTLWFLRFAGVPHVVDGCW